MTAEGSAVPPPAPPAESTPVPESVPEPVPAPTPTVELATVPISQPEPVLLPAAAPAMESVISPEAVKEISATITEGVKEVILGAPVEELQPEPPMAAPAATSTSSPAAPSPTKSSRGHMLAVVRARKAERLEKIMEMVRQKGVIANDDVEMLLKVSNATATRYLNELVKAGRLKRFGARKHEKYEAM